MSAISDTCLLRWRKASAFLGIREIDQKSQKPVGFFIAKECILLQSFLNHNESRASNMSSEARDYRF